MKLLGYVLPVVAAILTSCGDHEKDSPALPDIPGQPSETPVELPELPFARGADVSWVTQQESENIVWRDSLGNPAEVMKLLRDECGVNAIRLRVWVDPANGWNGLDDTVAKAKRAKALGMMLMIDFHFSSTWADPGRQTPPPAWAGYNIQQLKSAVAAHVAETLNALKKEGIEPEWVQIGNEVRFGMLWPLGSGDNPANFAALVNAGYDAAKKIVPKTRVIVHIDSGQDYSLYLYLYGILAANSGKYDMIGVSLYPDADNWTWMVNTMIDNLKRAASTWHKEVMVCEVGMNWNQPQITADMLRLMLQLSLHNTDNRQRGIFYWEPQAPPGYNNGYDKGAFDLEGRPTIALHPFVEAAKGEI